MELGRGGGVGMKGGRKEEKVREKELELREEGGGGDRKVGKRDGGRRAGHRGGRRKEEGGASAAGAAAVPLGQAAAPPHRHGTDGREMIPLSGNNTDHRRAGLRRRHLLTTLVRRGRKFVTQTEERHRFPSRFPRKPAPNRRARSTFSRASNRCQCWPPPSPPTESPGRKAEVNHHSNKCLGVGEEGEEERGGAPGGRGAEKTNSEMAKKSFGFGARRQEVEVES